MIKKQVHILNGDALRERFPSSIGGELIVARECLVDGDVHGDNLEALFKTRAEFLQQKYSEEDFPDYMEWVAPEFRKIAQLNNSIVILWFEDDLFCQVNLWFVLSLLEETNNETFRKNNQIFLVRPFENDFRGFGWLDETQLLQCYAAKEHIPNAGMLYGLWQLYQRNETELLHGMARMLEEDFPFILRAVQAHLDRIPDENNPGRPATVVAKLIEKHGPHFAPVFQDFCKEEAIYGFGDLQVKHLFDAIVANRN